MAKYRPVPVSTPMPPRWKHAVSSWQRFWKNGFYFGSIGISRYPRSTALNWQFGKWPDAAFRADKKLPARILRQAQISKTEWESL